MNKITVSNIAKTITPGEYPAASKSMLSSLSIALFQRRLGLDSFGWEASIPPPHWALSVSGLDTMHLGLCLLFSQGFIEVFHQLICSVTYLCYKHVIESSVVKASLVAIACQCWITYGAVGKLPI